MSGAVLARIYNHTKKTIQKTVDAPMMNLSTFVKSCIAALALSPVAAILLLCWMLGQAHSAATLLPNGEQCFSATTPTSGGFYGSITALGTISGGSGYDLC
jgi:hypothetical protein